MHRFSVKTNILDCLPSLKTSKTPMSGFGSRSGGCHESGKYVLDESPFNINSIYIEQQRRFSGSFEKWFQRWKKQDGGTFGYLELPKIVSHDKTQKDLKKANREQEIRDICDAQSLTDEEYQKREKDIEFKKSKMATRYWHCKRFCIRQDVEAEHLFPHMYRFKDKLQVRWFRILLWNRRPERNNFYDFNKFAFFHKLIKVCGFKDLMDDNKFTEKDGIVVNVWELKQLIAKNDRLKKEMNYEKAKGDKFTFLKYSLNFG